MVMVAHICNYTENHQIVHFKWVNVIMCKFYLNEAIVFNCAKLQTFINP